MRERNTGGRNEKSDNSRCRTSAGWQRPAILCGKPEEELNRKKISRAADGT